MYFFAIMSLTTIAVYLYGQNEISLFLAAGINLISTILKVGVRSLLAVEIFASSLVADLHLIPAFTIHILGGDETLVYSLVIGSCIANAFSLILIVIESVKSSDEF